MRVTSAVLVSKSELCEFATADRVLIEHGAIIIPSHGNVPLAGPAEMSLIGYEWSASFSTAPAEKSVFQSAHTGSGSVPQPGALTLDRHRSESNPADRRGSHRPRPGRRWFQL